MSPVQIKIIDKKYLYIKWSDSSESFIDLKKMRRLCPCATCKSEREEQSESYIPIINKEQIKIKKIEAVGSYAVGVTWKDGHSTGIYEYSFLKKLSDN